MKKLVVENNFIINLIIISSFIVHLASINFFPTNFEGGYGAYADFFHSDNKLIYLKSYYFTQFNTYLFSLIASFLKPDPLQKPAELYPETRYNDPD